MVPIQYFSESYGVSVQGSVFEKEGHTAELHLVLTPKAEGTFDQQLQRIRQTLDAWMATQNTTNSSVVFKRYFLSDAANQYLHLNAFDSNNKNYSVSVVQQPLLNGAKVALWVYLASNMTLQQKENRLVAYHNGYSHIWTSQLHGEGENADIQTADVFEKLNKELIREECGLEANCVRTWFYVNNVDVNYGGVVRSRKDIFERLGLTAQTHYIASTGIEGRNHNPNTIVIADAYSVKGVERNQIQFLKAATHMNPTIEYGVTFERGTAVLYGDRSHIFISGTASIDTKGDIVHEFDVARQAERAMENIDALLLEAQASREDIAQMIVYLRDLCDYSVVASYFETHYAAVPKVIVLAPVCRPGWLIEIECIAIAAQRQAHFQNF